MRYLSTGFYTKVSGKIQKFMAGALYINFYRRKF
jgi:hypothetical protein